MFVQASHKAAHNDQAKVMNKRSLPTIGPKLGGPTNAIPSTMRSTTTACSQMKSMAPTANVLNSPTANADIVSHIKTATKAQQVRYARQAGIMLGALGLFALANNEQKLKLLGSPWVPSLMVNWLVCSLGAPLKEPFHFVELALKSVGDASALHQCVQGDEARL